MIEAMGMAMPQVLLFVLIDHFLRKKISRRMRLIFALLFQSSITVAIYFSNADIEAASSNGIMYSIIFVFALFSSFFVVLLRSGKNQEKV